MRRNSGRGRFLFVILIVTSLFLITLDLRGLGITSATRSLTQTVISPIQKATTDLFSPVTGFLSDVKNFGRTKSELTDLKATNAKLKAEVAYSADIQGQLKQLRGALDLAARGGYKVVSARVIGQGQSTSFAQTITIDAGSTSGISSNMSVISPNGLVGLVKSVAIDSAVIELMSDPSFKVGVKIARNQAVGVLTGDGSSNFNLELLDPNANLQVGDILLTNGSDGNHPFFPGLPVGVVTSVDGSIASLTQKASVTSYSNLNSLGVVSVVISAPSTAPRVAISPTPIPTVTITINPAPLVSVSATAIATASASPSLGAPSIKPSVSSSKKR